jgi:carbon-monoxide dehydrogenase medium subunit
VLLLLDARFRIAGPTGERIVGAKDCFVDHMTTCLRPDEILVEVRVPTLPPGTGSAYTKLVRVEGGFAIVGVGAYLVVHPDRVCKEVRVGVGGATPVPLRVAKIEEVMQSREVDEEFINDAAEAAYAAVVQPTAELHADGAYKREMVRVFTRRALSTALTRARPRS